MTDRASPPSGICILSCFRLAFFCDKISGKLGEKLLRLY